jgi:chemotaxis protein CheY-P-specific phosphatase CheC
MSKLISKIGLNEFTKAFDADSVKGLVEKMMNKESDKGSVETVAAIQVLMEIVNIIMSHLQDCEKEVHSLLSNCTGISVAELKKVYAPDFFEMVVNFVKKDEFMDFYGVVSKLFK